MNIFSVVYDLGNITDWLSAIGTIGAVIVALYLSNKDRKPKAKVKSNVSYLVGPSGVSGPVQISLEILNQGLIPITIKECTLNYKGKNKMVFREGYSKVDKKLQPGDHYEHTIPFEPIAKLMESDNKKSLKTNFYFLDASGNKYKTKINLHL
ncbi:hypothetical protein M3638_01295 [Oceanobacillus profundus]|uniref:hypothetical protein n=1 Tax=Oceanobacillus profundus TaxID=372463 RepID=UPI00203B3C5E|nr:hypothetical protein [Oceanobacillus profundus]MCM3396469.1 hypothetical protein [Oceanobacillus profundus]